jgi:hypothetical protein
MNIIHQTASARVIEDDGGRFADCRTGKLSGAQIFFVRHARVELNYREAIPYKGRGASLETGTPRNCGNDMVNVCSSVIRPCGLPQEVCLLGFSIDRYQVQEVTVRQPSLVRKLMLLGIGSHGTALDTSRNVNAHALWPQRQPSRNFSTCSSHHSEVAR